MELTNAAVPVVGRIIDIQQAYQFDLDANGERVPDGISVVIATGDGYAKVSLRKSELIAQLKPDFGQPVAWIVRYGANVKGQGAAAWSSFVKVMTLQEADQLRAGVAAAPSSQSKNAQPEKVAA